MTFFVGPARGVLELPDGLQQGILGEHGQVRTGVALCLGQHGCPVDVQRGGAWGVVTVATVELQDGQPRVSARQGVIN